MLTCPRCDHQFDASPADELEWLPCPSCSFEYLACQFDHHTRRNAQAAAWPNHPERQRLLSDTPSERSLSPVALSFSEWLRFKLGHSKTQSTLTMRSAAHELISAACRLGLHYPAIPRGISTARDARRFLTHPEHAFLVSAVMGAARDASFIANQYFTEGALTRGEIRHIIDTELPHSSWAGAAITYSPGKPEVRGLLLAVMLIRAEGSTIPELLLEIHGWIRADGWDDYGHAINSPQPNGA